MKRSLLILSLLTVLGTPSLVQATDCEQHPIYCNIVKLKPSINHTFAMELSNYIYRYSNMFHTNPNISIAIAMQESSLINQDRRGAVMNKQGKIVRGISDVGVFQLHILTIENMRKQGWDIDFQRLRTDVEYQTYWHTRLLKNKILACEKNREELKVELGEEWSCYHSFTFKLRETYKTYVSAYLAKLEQPAQE